MSKTPIAVRLKKIFQEDHEAGLLMTGDNTWVIESNNGTYIEGESLDEVIGNYFAATKPKRRNRKQAERRVDSEADTENG